MDVDCIKQYQWLVGFKKQNETNNLGIIRGVNEVSALMSLCDPEGGYKI